VSLRLQTMVELEVNEARDEAGLREDCY